MISGFKNNSDFYTKDLLREISYKIDIWQAVDGKIFVSTPQLVLNP